MRIYSLLPTVLATSAMASALAAQEPRIMRLGPGTIIPRESGMRNLMLADEPKAVIGIATTSAASSRDTLGVLVASVRSGSPADKAGIEEGNRIASVNGVSLKLAAADVGDDEMAGALSRRLSRELDKLKPGDEVQLAVYANGATKTVRVKTVSPEDLYASGAVRRDDERATLGLNLAITGNSRDTLGVFVLSTDDGSPAAKAGIEEGSRIASINGVDVRGSKPSSDDGMMMRTSGVSRLEREVSKLKPGDNVDLRVYFNGQYKNVKVAAGRLSDSPHRGRTMTIFGGDNFMIPPMAARIDGVELGDQIRRSFETARLSMDGALSGVGRALGRIGNRVQW
ncbi:MAG: PDZ domain-containing protein [Gemmatimonadaceae bacterium]